MDPLDLLKALRRRWPVIVAAVALALVPAWLTASNGPLRLGNPTVTYRATAVLLSTSSGVANPGGISSLDTIAALVTVGEVPARVAKDIKFKGDPVTFAEQVSASADTSKGIIRISAVSRDGPYAKKLADTFAREIIGFLDARNQAAIATQIDTVSRTLDRLNAQVLDLDHKIAAGKPNSARVALLTAQRDATVRQYGALYEFYQRLSTPLDSPGGGLQVIQDASPVPLAESGIQAPRTRSSRMILGGALGLLAGFAIALVLERLDRQIRTKRAAEEHFGLPLLAEIPPMRGADRRRLKTGTDRGRTPSTDAFQLLAAGVTHPPAGSLQPGEGNGFHAAPQTILVTSAGPGEGKSTIVAHLAAAFAEFGKSVLVLSCDFRRPSMHRVFGIPNDIGLADALQSPNGESLLGKHMHKTAFKEIRVVPSGERAGRSGGMLSLPAMRRALDEARLAADVVLVDTAPILTSDATPLLSEVDAVLVVARAGRTTVEMAERTSELLKRLGAPVIGIALNDANEMVVPRRYYGRLGRNME